MDELMFCPFCGRNAIMHKAEYPSKCVNTKKEIPKDARIIRSFKYPAGKIYYEFREQAYIPQCSDSKCLGRSNKMFKNEKEAIEAWNRRADNGHV